MMLRDVFSLFAFPCIPGIPGIKELTVPRNFIVNSSVKTKYCILGIPVVQQVCFWRKKSFLAAWAAA